MTGGSDPGPATGPDSLLHPAFFYRGDDEYLAGTLPFIHDSLAADRPVAAAVPGRRLTLLRGALGAAARRVKLIDMSVAGRNPGRIIPGVLSAFADAHPTAERVRIIGEPVWPGRSAHEYAACAEHEALINLAFAGRAITILCPYDAKALAPEMLAEAAVTHPTVVDGGRERTSGAYAPGEIIRRYDQPLPEPDSPRTTMDFGVGGLRRARRFGGHRAARLGLSPDRLPDLDLVVGELLAYFVLEGDGTGTLAVWTADDHLICQITGSAPLADPLVGRLPAALRTAAGRAVLLANYVSDLVRTHVVPGGTTIRMYFDLTAGAR